MLSVHTAKIKRFSYHGAWLLNFSIKNKTNLEAQIKYQLSKLFYEKFW